MSNEDIKSLINTKFEPIVEVEKLAPEVLTKAKEVAAGINLGDSQAIIQYGVGAQRSISGFADNVLKEIHTKDGGYAGEILSELLVKVKELDVGSLSTEGSFFSKIPILGGLIDSAKRFMERYQKLSVHIERIVSELEKARMNLLKDINMLDQMHEKNLEYLRDLDVYIAGGQLKIQEIRTEVLPGALKAAEESSDPAEAQKLQDLAQFLNRFEKKLHDLKLSRMVSIQTGPQVRLIQGGNQVLVEKIQSSILQTIPLWKNQIVIAISIFRQKKALELQKEVTDTTNDLLAKNAEMLKEGTIGVMKESERGIVEIETLKKVNTDLIGTIEEVLKIQSEGRQKREAAEKEITLMESELKAKLTNVGN